MKKKFMLILCAIVFIFALFSGCGQQKPDISNKYIVVSDSVYGIKFVNECYSSGGTFKEKLEWVEGRSYAFKYDVYYDDNDQPTGESGGVYDVSGEPGSYFIRAYANLGKGNKEYDIFIDIDPPLTLKFDTEGTVEYTENERYVYKYDASVEFQYPTPRLYFNGKRLLHVSENYDWGSEKSFKKNDIECLPKEIGVYDTIYNIEYNWKNSGGELCSYKFSQNIIIEIIQ